MRGQTPEAGWLQLNQGVGVFQTEQHEMQRKHQTHRSLNASSPGLILI